MRDLTQAEITRLQTLGCRAEDWCGVQVADPFHPDRIRGVHFQGRVSIGVLDSQVNVDGSLKRPSGLYDSTLSDCTFGDNVYICGVSRLANYDVDSGVVVENVGSIVCDGQTCFGNGLQLDVLNEAGGRTLPIFDRLSAQIAYLMVFYRHDAALIERLSAIISTYAEGKTSQRGRLGFAACLRNTNTVLNCWVGPYARIDGALQLEDGTVASCREDPTLVGQGVIAKHFIVQSGSKVDGATIIDKCFVGQGVTLGKQFSAENSLFFANTEGFHGEAVSMFAGPYTVTHHKSTLLIAGLFSFYNAGSGTNQSNHMYKLGPVHQGVLERGCKTSSASYLLWPCRVGAFSAVVGKHYSNFDTSDLPFSYITEEQGKSVLTPAMNLLTVGTRRDADKWPARDKRKDPCKLDLIRFNLLSPYIVAKMVRGAGILLKLQAETPRKQEFVTHQGINIRRLMLKTCARYYEMGVHIFIGDCLSARLEQVAAPLAQKELLSILTPQSIGVHEWADIGGMLAPRELLQTLVDAVKSGEVQNIENLISWLQTIHAAYEEAEWAWCVQLVEKRLGTRLSQMTGEHLMKIIADWSKSRTRLNNMIAADASKEFHPQAQIGYGIDGGEDERKLDFEAVRGTYDDNRFVRELREDSERVEARAKRLHSLLSTTVPDCA